MNSRGYLPSRFAPLGKIISSAVHLHFRWIIVNYLFWITMHCNAIHSGTNISIDGLIYTGFVPNILQIMNPLNSCPGARVGRTSLFWTEVIISILKCGRNTTDLFMTANIATYHSLIHSWHKVCIIIHNFVLLLFWKKKYWRWWHGDGTFYSLHCLLLSNVWVSTYRAFLSTEPHPSWLGSIGGGGG